jgi:predicted mannosyl-3-phosphoglycerate phosphatase (HAD superfamily)
VRGVSGGPLAGPASDDPASELVLSENIFHLQLTKERRRADRSRKPFFLMLLDSQQQDASAAGTLQRVLNALAASKRETDVVGWYKNGEIAGVIFTEVNVNTEHAIMKMLRARTESALAQHLGKGVVSDIAISMHVFPESWDPEHSGKL